ncbi:hypothetical protein FOA43_002280 [Brettanomyces nanus]|uniref:Actin-related protein 2/3 complex subunit 5 n=1 Tax=Eeniella nana TaxID=13502 RepID=A0A875S4F0_EENNA|nr:uncharacterized protein FOA43_002280 [Brettanomyces nanus]QPG74942.1 hypothetical protein FOA43_002280 [Brettanomyces nanus]
MEDWRRVDVDQYDPEKQFIADDLELPNYSAQDLEPKIQQIRQYIGSNDLVNALKSCVQDPPYGSTDIVKKGYLLTVLDVLNTAKQSEVKELLSQLSIDEVDVLVKFIYVLMTTEEGQKSGGALLGWFDKAITVVGEGPIVRYMSDPYRM